MAEKTIGPLLEPVAEAAIDAAAEYIEHVDAEQIIEKAASGVKFVGTRTMKYLESHPELTERVAHSYHRASAGTIAAATAGSAIAAKAYRRSKERTRTWRSERRELRSSTS